MRKRKQMIVFCFIWKMYI